MIDPGTLVSMAGIARRAGVQRPAVTNWRRRHADFPAPVRHSPQELFDAAEVARWLDARRVSARARRPGEPAGSTFGERFRLTYAAGRSDDTAPAPPSGGGTDAPAEARTVQPPSRPDNAEERAHRFSTLLMSRAHALSGVGDPAAYTDVILILLYLRTIDPQNWTWLAAESRRREDLTELLREVIDRHVAERPARTWLPHPARRVADEIPPAARRDMMVLIDLLESLAPPGSAPAPEPAARVLTALLDEAVRQEGHRGGEFHTPRSVTELVAGLAAPQPGDRILDPCCGSGGLLVAAAAPLQTPDSVPVTGRALSPRPSLWAGINLALHDVPARLSSDALDELRHPVEPGESYDLVVSNPPFAMHWANRVEPGDHRWVYGVPPGNNANFAWLQHIAARLAPQGRAVVVTPPNATFSARRADQTIRAGMIEDGLVACVIRLPAGLFASTGIPVTVWVLDRGRRPGTDVLMIDAGDTAEADFPEIVRTFRQWSAGQELEDPPIPARTVGVEELRDANHSLNPAQYLLPGASGADQREAVEIFRSSAAHVAQITWTGSRIDGKVAELTDALLARGLGDGARDEEWRRAPLEALCTVQPGPPRTELSDDGLGVPVVTARQIRNRRIGDADLEHATVEFAASVPQCRLSPGDVVSVRTGTIDRVALAGDRHAGWLIGSGCVLLRPGDDILPSYLLHYLTHPQVVEWVRRSATSAVLPTISIRKIRELPVLVPPIERQREIVELLDALDEKMGVHDGILRATREMHASALGALLGDIAARGRAADPL